MDTQNKIRVLVVDDDRTVRDFLTRLLAFEGLEAKSANDGCQALEMVQKEKFNLAFLDIKMPRMNGLETFSKLKKLDPDLSCVFMTGYALEEELIEKTKQPGTACLRKPFEDIRQIKEIANKVMQEARSNHKIANGIRERRAYARLDIPLETDYKITEREKPSIAAASSDISLGGIRLIAPENIAAGIILELRMKAPAGIESCQAQGEVVWSRSLPDKPGYYEIGVRFFRIDHEQLAALFIRSEDLPIERRGYDRP